MFPHLPTATYTPRPDNSQSLDIQDLKLVQSNIHPATYVWAAWALLSSKLGDADDASFRITKPGGARDSASVNISVEGDENIHQFLHRLQGLGNRNPGPESPDGDDKTTLVFVLESFKECITDTIEDEIAKTDFAIVLKCHIYIHDVRIQIYFDSHIVGSEEIVRICHQLEHLLRQLAAADAKHKTIAEVGFVGERDLLEIWKWNEAIASPIDTHVTEMIAAHARDRPEATAITAWNGEFTYRELDELSTKVAKRLRQLGVSPGSIVPISFEKSKWTPVALLGNMKAGGATIALDTTQPEERLRSIIQQVDPRLILSSPAKQELANRLVPGRVEVLDDDIRSQDIDIAKLPAGSMERVPMSSTSFLLFTSGSTGLPKGVCWDFRSAATVSRLIPKALGIDQNSRVFHFASYAFTVGVLEMLITLTSGGTLCTPSEASKLNELSDAMANLRVNWAFIVPSLAKMIEPSSLPDLKTAILTGESLTEGDVKRWIGHVAGYNYYGCTECPYIGWSRTDDGNWRNGKVGLASGTAHWIADATDPSKLVPIGAVGQLLVEGPVVAKDYYNRSDLFQQSLCIDPPWLLKGHGGRTGRKGVLFKTGDLVRYDRDGAIVFVGRRDAQVKIRGQRVELREVEHHIRTIIGADKIDVAVDVITPQGSSNPLLVAFLAQRYYPIEHDSGSISDLTDGLDKKLSEVVPLYMVPSAFCKVDEIPLLKSGKCDRRRVREMGEALTLERLTAASASRKRFEPAKTRMEEILQALFASVLGIEQTKISANDAFLQLGGDSICAMRLVAKARQQNLTLSVTQILQAASLRELSRGMLVDGEEETKKEDNVAPFSLLPNKTNADDVRMEAATQCGIDVADIEDIYPCTPLQKGMLAVTEKIKGSYVIQHVLKLREGISIDQLRTAIVETGHETPILRTRIFDFGGRDLLNVIVKDGISPPKIVDNLRDYLDSDKQVQMSLGTALSRSAIVRNENGGKQYLVWTIHHSIHDGWAIGLLLDRVENRYKGMDLENAPTFQQYISCIQETDERDAEKFWLGQFEDASPQDLVRLPQSTYQPVSNSSFAHTIKGLESKLTGYTMPVIIRAAWAILISRYTSSSDVVFGTTVMGRQGLLSAAEHIVGPTIATLPLRQKIDPRITVEGLLSKIHMQANEMVPFEHMGLSWIRRLLQNSGYNGDFQTLLVIQPKEYASPIRNAQLLFDEDVDNPEHGVNSGWQSMNTYAMTVECQLGYEDAVIRVSFDSKIIDQQQVKRIMKQLEFVIHQLCAHRRESSKLLADVDVTSEQDVQDIWKWNETHYESVNVCPHELISKTVRRQPDAIAICAWDGNFSYRQLEDLSDRLAFHLLDLGVKSTMILPLVFEKSKWTAVAQMATMKAGAAVVVMDPVTPQARLSSIVSQIDSRMILSSKQSHDLADNLVKDASVIVIDEENSEKWAPRPSHELPTVDPSSQLFLIFTSGSTGTPKGASLSRSNLSSAMVYHSQYYEIDSHVRTYDFSSYNFDYAWSNLLVTLYVGGCLCVPSADERNNDLTRSLQRFNANFVFFTPSTLRAIIPQESETIPIKTLALGGEYVRPADIPLWARKIKIFHMYGPTECTMFATSIKIYDPKLDETLPIGSGVVTNTWIVDTQDPSKLAPVGAVGSLWLEGPGVGKGYFQDPEKTAASFSEDPAWLLRGSPTTGVPGRRGRLYRTGDLVRYGSDNVIYFIGREDAQVKIRGQRLELGEVEYHVQRLLPPRAQGTHAIIETVPVRDTGKPALFAFISPPDASVMSWEDVQTEVAAIGAELKESLSAALPAYMVPSVYVPVQKMPMLASGKVDRRRLRELGALNDWSLVWNKTSNGIKKPSNLVQAKLRDIWSHVLDLPVEAISMDTAFTRLGGDSISAMQVCSRCRAEEISITVAEILKYQTIEQLGPRCKDLPSKLVFAEDEAEGDSWDLSPIQQIHFDGHPGGTDHFNQAFLLRVRFPVTTEDLAAATTALIERHAMLRARYRVKNESGSWEQYVVPASSESFHFVEMQVNSEDEAAKYARQQQKVLRLAKGPVFSLVVFNLKGSKLKLVSMSGHHLVVDLMSWRIIWHDLVAYLQNKQGFQPPPISFRTWSRLQKKEALQTSGDQIMPLELRPPQVDYWGSGCLEQNTHEDSELYIEVIDAQTTKLLLGESNESLRTEPIDLMLAGLIISFCQTFAERTPPTILVEGHGREAIDGMDIDLSETVGWFTTMYPMQFDNVSTQDIVDIVGMVKDYRRNVPAKGRLWFAHSVYSKYGRRDFEQQWPGELLFNYMGQFQQLERQGFFERIATDLQAVSTSMKRMALIEINADIQNSEFHMLISVNKHMAHQNRLQTWVKTFSFTLKQIAKVMQSSKPKFTPSDFPLLQISRSSLDNFVTSNKLAEDEITDIYPVTGIQEGILLSIHKATASYGNVWVWECSGQNILPSRLEQAWKRTAQRHSILKNIFLEDTEKGTFVQIELKNPIVLVEHVSSSDKAVDALFNCASPTYGLRTPQHLFRICQSSNGSVACRLDMSHTLIDASSIPVLLRDLSNFYSGIEPVIPAPKFQDVVRYMQKRSKDATVGYWSEFLKDVQICELPVSQNRSPSEDTNTYGYREIAGDLTSDIDRFCRHHNVTRAVLLEIAWALVLSIYTNTNEVCFGYVASGRDIEVDGVENAVGPLLSLLLARIDLDKPLSDVLSTTHKDSAEHFDHQHVSLAEIQHRLGLGNRRLFNTAVTIRDSFEQTGNGEITFHQVHVEDSNEYDILLVAGLNRTHTELGIHYRKAFASESFMQELQDTLEKALEFLLCPETTKHDLVSQSLNEIFYAHITGIDRHTAIEIWGSRPEVGELQAFPILPSTKYVPCAGESISIAIPGVSMADDTFHSAAVVSSAIILLHRSYTNAQGSLIGLTKGHSALPLPICLESGMTVRQLLERARKDIQRIMKFDNITLSQIRRLGGNVQRACEFQTIVTVETDQKQSNASEKVKNTFPLHVLCRLDSNCTKLCLTFDPNVIRNDQARRMVNQLAQVIRRLLEEDSLDCSALSIETTSQLDIEDMQEWNKEVPATIEARVHEIIGKVALEYQTKSAIEAWDGRLTYKQLENMSTHLGLHLTSLGVKKGMVVPLCFPKSAWMPVAALAVMKTGAAFIALDTSLPTRRLQDIVEYVQSTVLLTAGDSERLARKLTNNKVVIVNEDTLANLTISKELPLPNISPEDPLYVVSTSGSTGKPKFPTISHSNFASAIYHQRPIRALDSSVRAYDFASYAFDAAVSNLIHVLAAGGCLCIPSEEQRKSDLVASMNAFQATYADLTPSTARLLRPELVPSLKVLILAGEPMTVKDAEIWGSRVDLRILYGPAECSVAATGTKWNESYSSGDIGSGIGLNTWVVDIANNCLSPVGAVGSLWLEGPLVGLGYYRDNEKTTTSFVDNPTWLNRKGRVYCTGDLVRYNGDGTLTFVGREDTQVKLRGQRIELAEIEYHAGNVFGENEVVYLASEVIKPKDSDRQLLAMFYKCRTDAIIPGINEKSVERLSEVLPSYMVPTSWINLKEFPITPTGKIDRRRIRDIGSSMSLKTLISWNELHSHTHHNPQTISERNLQRLWAAVLDIEIDSISINDNFLRIGDSLHAMHLTSAARKAGFSLSVADVFKYPRLRDMAKQVELTSGGTVKMSPFSLLKPGFVENEIRAQTALLCGINPDDIEDIFPTTPLQAGLLALTQRNSGDYIMRQALELRFNIDLVKFKRSWEAVVAATPILRTRIVDLTDQGLVQVVVDEKVEWAYSDTVDTFLHSRDIDKVGMGSRLTKYGLVSDTQAKKNWFVIILHHAVYDGWSVQKLLKFTEQSYQNPRSCDLLTTPFQLFVSYAIEHSGENGKNFWREHFAGSEMVQFPTLPSPDYNPRADKEFSQTLKNIDWPDMDVTPATIIRTAWGVLQSSYTGSCDSIFGAVVSGRQAPVADIENVIGPTIATVPVRVSLRKGERMDQLLQRVHEDAISTIPFEQVGLQNIRNLGELPKSSCNFQTLLVIQPPEDNEESSLFSGIARGAEGASARFSSYALVMDVEIHGRSLKLRLSFDANIIKENQAEQLVAGFERVLQSICSKQCSVFNATDIEVIGDAELEEIWQQNSLVPSMVNRCVHDLIFETARRQPDQIAVSAWDGEWTYGQLDELSARFAGRLVKAGIRPGEMVPLCIEKSKWMSIAVCGVMRAGGVCLALDSNQPEARLAMIVRQVHPKLIVSSVLNTRLSNKFGLDPVLVVDDSLSEADDEATTLPVVDPASPLFVLFTSGSTGTPKGVVINHNNFASGIFYQGDIFEINPGERVFDFASYSFDISWFNALQSFARGACLCVPSESERQNDIAGALRRYKSTFAFLTPTVLRILRPEDCPNVKMIALGGEPQRWTDFEPWVAHQVKTLTVYGPAECTVVSTATSSLALKGSDFFIGSGKGLNIWVVDPDKETLTPMGAVGEIWLEGPLVGQGYYKDHEKTSAAFVRDPSWLIEGSPNHPGRSSRLYRSGDLVRRNLDGTLTSVGRKDTQIKIRGQRVELGEVEYCAQRLLKSQGSVSRVVVDVATPKGGRDPLLVAFLHIPEANMSTMALGDTIRKVEEDMSSLLPSYMIPSAWVQLLDLPVTVNGKTDRNSLRHQVSEMTVDRLLELNPRASKRVKPKMRMEEDLQQLWAKILGRNENEISVDDSFFRLGGDSVAAMRFVSAARRAGIEITVAELFKQPRLGALAAGIKNQEMKIAKWSIASFSLLNSESSLQNARGKAAALCGIKEDHVSDIYPCTSLQEGLLAMTARDDGNYVAYFKIPLKHGVSVTRFTSAWNHLVSNTAILRTRIVDLPNQGLVQVVLDMVPKLRECKSEDSIAQNNSFVPRTGSDLMQASLVHDKSGAVIFEWTLHHAIYDGWSMALYLETLENAYFQRYEKTSSPFNLFIKYLQERDDKAELQYWQGKFEGFDSVQFPKLPSTSYHPKPNAMELYSISKMKWPEADITASTAVKAAWAILLSRYTYSSDVTFGVVTAGRQAAVENIEKIAGPTIATIPLPICVDGNLTVADLLHRVQQQGIDSIPFEQLGLANIQRLSSSAQNACQFQSLLMIQPADEQNESKLFLARVEDNLGPDASTAAQFNTYALMLWCELGENGLNIQASYDSHVISQSQVHRLLRQFEQILRQTTQDSTAVREITAISQQDLSDVWNWNSVVPKTFKECVHHLIHGTALRHPHLEAICAWDGSLTYKELNDKSTALAYQLLQTGVKYGTTVPLCIGKSKNMPIAALAVMKVGATCLALDVNQPQQRLRAIVERVNADHIISCNSERTLASQLSVENILIIEQMNIRGNQTRPRSVSLPKVDPSSLLYIVFTSGSTGTPKGVTITHSNFASAARHQRQSLSLDRKSRVYDFSSYAFDVSWSNILATLITGGCVCIPSEFERMNDTSSSMLRLKTNLASLTPHVACSLTTEALQSLNILQLTGEHASRQQIEHLSQFVDLRIAYGPAECTVYSTISDVCRTPLTIGRGVGTCTWIVDPTNDDLLAPVGSVGELLIEGPLVAPGYLEDRDRTAASFIQDPIWLLNGSHAHTGRNGKIYKTGDLVRYNHDGTLVFLGRKDNQIKIRGQRVELEEIEHNVKHVLSSQFGPVEVIVDTVLSKDEQRSPLIAFVSSNLTERETLQQQLVKLRVAVDDMLAQRLPSYMLPTTYLAIDIVPLSVTGKIDRPRLRDLYASLTPNKLATLQPVESGKRPPTDVSELNLHALWVSVLQVSPDSISATDNFFRIGGDSISAMRLVESARRKGLSINVADIFRNPRLENMARVLGITKNTLEGIIPPFSLLDEGLELDKMKAEAANICNTSISQISDIFPCTPLQVGLIALTSKRPEDYIARHVLELQSTTDVSRLQEAWAKVLEANPILRARIIDLPGQGMVQVILNLPIAWSFYKTMTEYRDADRQVVMGLGKPLLKLAIISDDSETKIHCSVTIHHSTYDGWSMSSVLDQVAMAYGVGFKAPSTSFQSFVKHIREISVDAATKFWTEQFSGIQATQYPHLPSPDYEPKADGIFEHSIINLELTQRSHTLSTLIRASWAIMMCRQVAGSEALFGSVTAGRQASLPGIERVSGPTVATVPLLIPIDWENSVQHLLASIEKQATDMIEFEQTGLREIQALGGDDAKDACSFQTLLVVQPPIERSAKQNTIFSPMEHETIESSLFSAFATYALTAECVITDGGIDLRVRFDSHVIGKVQVERLCHQFERIICQLSLESSYKQPVKFIESASERELHSI